MRSTYVRLAVIRLRGLADTSPEVEKTLDLLRLRRRNTCVIVEAKPSIMGMLNVVKDWVTWGEIDADTLAELLRRRGRLVGDKPLTDEWLSKYGWSSIEEFALAYVRGEVERLSCGDVEISGKAPCIPKLKPFFRLRPPTGGFRSIKKPYNKGGDLGYRGPLINDLIMRSI